MKPNPTTWTTELNRDVDLEQEAQEDEPVELLPFVEQAVCTALFFMLMVWADVSFAATNPGVCALLQVGLMIWHVAWMVISLCPELFFDSDEQTAETNQ